MTKEFLEGYRSKKEEIRELKNKLRSLGEGDELIGNDVIMDYRTGYPRPQSLVATDQEKYRRISSKYEKAISKLEEECNQVEKYVEAIEDSRTRRIFRMRYIEGKRQEEIGRIMHLERSSVSRSIQRHMEKVSHNSRDSHL